jgi:hypothetical protein
LKNSAFLTWAKQQKRSLMLLVLFPYSIPVLFPAPSLLRISSVRQKNLKNADGVEVFEMPGEKNGSIFPVFFPVNGNFLTETVRWRLRPPPEFFLFQFTLLRKPCR